MRVLAFDPGAKRAGWAVLEPGPNYIASGVVETARGKDELYQHYRIRLALFWVEKTEELLEKYKPHYVVTETVPVRGMNDFAQGYLANVMASTVHAIAISEGIPVFQASARTVQKAIAVRGKSKSITKPQVRNGVLGVLPHLKDRGKDWMKVYEEPDALAIGLWFLRSQGCDKPTCPF